MRPIAFSVFLGVSAAATAPALAEDPAPVTALLAIVQADDEASDPMDSVPAAAIDAGEEAVAALTDLLKSKNSDTRHRAAGALSYIGGRAAVDALRAAWNSDHDIRFKTAAVIAMASTGSESDLKFLRRSLKGEHFGSEWAPIMEAAHALGALRDRASIPKLERTATKTRGSFASSAAEDALRWIAKGSWDVSDGGIDEPVTAVLRHGLPSLERDARFFDADRGLVWVLEKGRWSTLPNSKESKDLPKLRLETHVSPDDRRALVGVGVLRGPLDGEGYDFVLRRVNGQWRVQAVIFVWVS